MSKENTEFIKDVCDTFEELKLKFIEKNDQYATNDPLADFKTGAMLDYHSDSYGCMYSTAKDYVKKHIAHIFNFGIDGVKIAESLMDIAIYAVIMLYMVKKNKEKKK